MAEDFCRKFTRPRKWESARLFPHLHSKSDMAQGLVLGIFAACSSPALGLPLNISLLLIQSSLPCLPVLPRPLHLACRCLSHLMKCKLLMMSPLSQLHSNSRMKLSFLAVACKAYHNLFSLLPVKPLPLTLPPQMLAIPSTGDSAGGSVPSSYYYSCCWHTLSSSACLTPKATPGAPESTEWRGEPPGVCT